MIKYIVIKKERLAYIAGLFDGEGYIRIAKDIYRIKLRLRRNPTYSVRIGISMCNPYAIKYIFDNFDGSIHKMRSSRAKPNHRTLYGWIATSKKAYAFLTAIRPWLIVKAEEADIAIEFQKHIDSTKRWPIQGKPKGFSSHPQTIIDYRESIFQKLSQLKVKHFS